MNQSVTPSDALSLPCPRDGAPLAPHERDAPGIARCTDCHGVWASSAAAGALHRALPHLERARAQVLASPRHGTGVAACPGCGAAPVAVSFYEVPLDWCAGCGGVWLDGPELGSLDERVRALGGSLDAARSPFRVAPVQGVVAGTVTCGACGVAVPVNRSFLTSDGTRCVPCASAAAGEHPSPEAAAEVAAFIDRERRASQGWALTLADWLLTVLTPKGW